MPSQSRLCTELDYDIRELIEQLSDLVVAKPISAQNALAKAIGADVSRLVAVKNDLATRVIGGWAAENCQDASDSHVSVVQ